MLRRLFAYVLPAGDFLIGDNDLRLGEIGSAPFSVSR